VLHLLSSLTLIAGLAIENDSTELRREKLMDALRSGGYTVMLRHERTAPSTSSAIRFRRRARISGT
jgi:hypothetical protein